MTGGVKGRKKSSLWIYTSGEEGSKNQSIASEITENLVQFWCLVFEENQYTAWKEKSTIYLLEKVFTITWLEFIEWTGDRHKGDKASLLFGYPSLLYSSKELV